MNQRPASTKRGQNLEASALVPPRFGAFQAQGLEGHIGISRLKVSSRSEGTLKLEVPPTRDNRIRNWPTKPDFCGQKQGCKNPFESHYFPCIAETQEFSPGLFLFLVARVIQDIYHWLPLTVSPAKRVSSKFMEMDCFVFFTRHDWPGRMDHKAASGKKKSGDTRIFNFTNTRIFISQRCCQRTLVGLNGQQN